MSARFRCCARACI